jgi:hypothetical protein
MTKPDRRGRWETVFVVGRQFQTIKMYVQCATATLNTEKMVIIDNGQRINKEQGMNKDKPKKINYALKVALNEVALNVGSTDQTMIALRLE